MKLSKRGRREGWSRLRVVLVVGGLAVLSAAVAVVTRRRSTAACVMLDPRRNCLA